RPSEAWTLAAAFWMMKRSTISGPLPWLLAPIHGRPRQVTLDQSFVRSCQIIILATSRKVVKAGFRITMNVVMAYGMNSTYFCVVAVYVNCEYNVTRTAIQVDPFSRYRCNDSSLQEEIRLLHHHEAGSQLCKLPGGTFEDSTRGKRVKHE